LKGKLVDRSTETWSVGVPEILIKNFIVLIEFFIVFKDKRKKAASLTPSNSRGLGSGLQTRRGRLKLVKGIIIMT
jgi:hypothetical protein